MGAMTGAISPIVMGVGIACLVYNNGTKTHNSPGNWLQMVWDTDVWDPYEFHSTSTNTARLTVPAGMDGLYLVGAWTQWDSNATGARSLAVDHINSSGTRLRSSRSSQQSINASEHNAIGLFSAVGGDYFASAVYQNSGGNRTYNVNTGPNDNGLFCIKVA